MTPTKFKRNFLRQVHGFDAYEQLFNLIPDVAFFVKDRKCRLVSYNTRSLESCGLTSEEEVIGKVGYEYYAADRMDEYIEQDVRVMKSGKPILNAICPTPETGSNAMIVYSKIPLRNRRGRVIGLVGIWR